MQDTEGQIKREEEEVEEEEEEEGDEEGQSASFDTLEEPLVSNGIAATLKLLQQKGGSLPTDVYPRLFLLTTLLY